MTVNVNAGVAGIAAAYTSGQAALFFEDPGAGWVATPFTENLPDTWYGGFGFPNGFTPFFASACQADDGVGHLVCSDGTTGSVHHFIADPDTQMWVEDPFAFPEAIQPTFGAPNITWLPGGRILALGHCDNNRDPSNTVYIWTRGLGWAAAANNVYSCISPVLSTFSNGQVICLGGSIAGNFTASNVSSYTDAGGFVSAGLAPYPVEASEPGMLPSGKLFFVGGRARNGATANTNYSTALTIGQNGAGGFTYTQATFPGGFRSDVLVMPTDLGVRLYGGADPTANNGAGQLLAQVWDYNEQSGTFTQQTSAPGPLLAARPVILPDNSLLFAPQADVGTSGFRLVTTNTRGALVPTYYRKL